MALEDEQDLTGAGGGEGEVQGRTYSGVLGDEGRILGRKWHVCFAQAFQRENGTILLLRTKEKD